jgi:hypothetical protein
MTTRLTLNARALKITIPLDAMEPVTASNAKVVYPEQVFRPKTQSRCPPGTDLRLWPLQQQRRRRGLAVEATK